jgi:hypothetical protein
VPGIDAPCETWVTARRVRSCAPCEGKDVSDETYTNLALVASTWLWRMTGRRFSGQCQETVRPIPACNWATYTPWNRGLGTTSVYDWFDSRRGVFGPSNWGKRGEGVYEVTLGYYPINQVQTVKIDGQVFDPSNYRVDDARYLVRTDGNPWPTINELWREDTAENTWSVTFLYGDDPPADGIFAAQILACELVKANTGDEACRLPRGVQTISRQGVAMVMVDPARFLDAGLFGIPEVDNFIRTTNPNRLQQRSTVINIDRPRAVRRTGTAPGS